MVMVAPERGLPLFGSTTTAEAPRKPAGSRPGGKDATTTPMMGAPEVRPGEVGQALPTIASIATATTQLLRAASGETAFGMAPCVECLTSSRRPHDASRTTPSVQVSGFISYGCRPSSTT